MRTVVEYAFKVLRTLSAEIQIFGVSLVDVKTVFNKRVKLISSINRSEKQPMYFKSKGKTFRINVEDATVAPGLQYETIPVYTCRNIYIDDELVCCLHKLERLFTKTYLAEFSSKRHDYEVTELIEVAYKKAKKLDKEYWKAWFAKQQKESSFYDKKNN